MSDQPSIQKTFNRLVSDKAKHPLTGSNADNGQGGTAVAGNGGDGFAVAGNCDDGMAGKEIIEAFSGMHLGLHLRQSQTLGFENVTKILKLFLFELTLLSTPLVSYWAIWVPTLNMERESGFS